MVEHVLSMYESLDSHKHNTHTHTKYKNKAPARCPQLYNTFSHVYLLCLPSNTMEQVTLALAKFYLGVISR